MAVKPKETYVRNAVVERVIDGDTVALDIDLGISVHVKVSCRLADINAPELNTTAGKASKAWLQEQLPAGTAVVVQTIKGKETEKYGRYLATVFKGSSLLSINEQLVAKGLAVVYES